MGTFDPRLLPLWGAGLVGAWCWPWPRSDAPRSLPISLGVWAFSLLGLANLMMYWLLVPYRTQQRFMFQAIGLLAIPLARLLDRGSWLRMLATALLAVHLVTGEGWPFATSQQEPPWDLSPAVPSIVPPILIFPYLFKRSQGRLPDPEDVTSSVTLLVLGTAAFAAAWLWSRPGRLARVG